MSSGSGLKMCLILLPLLYLSDLGMGQGDNRFWCLNTGNYTANSTYSSNLDATLSALTTNTSQYGFYSASTGRGRDISYAVALCLADMTMDQCSSCVGTAVTLVKQACPNQTEAMGWVGVCMLHYSNKPITGLPSNINDQDVVNPASVNNSMLFRQNRGALMDALVPQAANGSSLLKVAVGSINTSDGNTIYSLIQCIPTLSSKECNDCLTQGVQNLPPTSQGARQLRSSCILRYELYPIYNETRLQELNVQPIEIPILNSPPPVGSGGGGGDGNTGQRKDKNTNKIIIIVLVPIVACVILAASAFFFLRKRAKRQLPEVPEIPEDTSTVESLQYDFRLIKAATNDFSDANKLGEGGFGPVYRGILPNGREMAVKRLSWASGQGEREFKNEVWLVAKLQHRNLVRLLGYSLEGKERLLIYEYVENASLDQFIFDPIKASQLNWDRRSKIIASIAKGLLYLHEDSRVRIIHRDLKAANILLDGEMNPKIADFGMAKLFGQDETQGKTSKIAGTYGYMSPEYAIYGKFSVKSDVFSFGVLALEVISGKKNMILNGENIESILSFVWENWCEGTTENIFDPVLMSGRVSIEDMLRCIHIALLCVQENADYRPTMNSVVVMLSSSTVTLPVPSQPAFVGTRFNSTGSTVEVHISEASTQNEMSASEFYPR